MYAGRLLCLAPIYRAGAFRDFVGAYFGYNAAYSGSLSIAVRLLHTRQLIIQLFASGLAVLAIAGWSLALRKRSQHGTSEARMPSIYLNILLASVPLEIVAACLSGRDYSHYMLPLFPSLAVLAAWFLVAIQNSASERSVGAMVALALVFGFLLFSLAVYASDFSQASDPPRPDYVEVVKFIQRTTSPNDTIMVVGGTEAGYIALHTQRLPASRYFYQYPLIDAANPVAAEQRRQFMADLMTSRPAVIVSGNPLLGILCTSELDCAARNTQAPLSDYGYNSTLLPKLLKGFIASEYRPVQNFRYSNIRVFVRRDFPVPAS